MCLIKIGSLKSQSSMFCDHESCKFNLLKVKNKIVSLEDLHRMSNKCFKCFQVSNNSITKKTSHYVDIQFAEKFINHLENGQEEKEFIALLGDLKDSIVAHNCFDKKEEDKLKQLIYSAVSKGEIVMQKKLKEESEALNG